MGNENSCSGLSGSVGRTNTGSSPRQIDFLHMRVPVAAHFAAIPSYLHKIAIDADNSAHCLLLLPEHTLSDFEQSGLGCIHDIRHSYRFRWRTLNFLHVVVSN
jgi:hypothetical protein